jgi:hypothetical protein
MRATTRKEVHIIMSSGAAITNVNFGGMKKKFHINALKTAEKITGPMYETIPTMRTPNINTKPIDL